MHNDISNWSRLSQKDMLTDVVVRTKRFLSVSHGAVLNPMRRYEVRRSSMGECIKNAVDSHSNDTVPGALVDRQGTGADDALSVYMMPLLNSGFVRDPEASINAGPGLKTSNLSRPAQSQTLAPFIQQLDHSPSSTIDYCRSVILSETRTRPTTTFFDIQQVYGLEPTSTFQTLHRPPRIDGIWSFNHQTQSSLNTLLPHRDSRSCFCAPESNYICVACIPAPRPPSPPSPSPRSPSPRSPSSRPPYQAFIDCDSMALPPTTMSQRVTWFRESTVIWRRHSSSDLFESLEGAAAPE